MSPFEKIAIVGAGPVGSLAALYAAQRGYQVELYELRPGKVLSHVACRYKTDSHDSVADDATKTYATRELSRSISPGRSILLYLSEASMLCATPASPDFSIM